MGTWGPRRRSTTIELGNFFILVDKICILKKSKPSVALSSPRRFVLVEDSLYYVYVKYLCSKILYLFSSVYTPSMSGRGGFRSGSGRKRLYAPQKECFAVWKRTSKNIVGQYCLFGMDICQDQVQIQERLICRSSSAT